MIFYYNKTRRKNTKKMILIFTFYEQYLINEKLPELFKEWGFTYINPAESCPYKRGVQSIDAYAKNTPFQKISRKVEIEAFNQFSQNQGGLCGLWSYILLDLRLSNPDYTIQEIMKQVLKEKSIEKDQELIYVIIY